MAFLFKVQKIISFLIFFCSFCVSASPLDFINVENLYLRLSDDSLEAVMVDPSYTTMREEELPEKMTMPINLGVQLINYDNSLREIKQLAKNKIGFGQHISLELKTSDETERCVEVAWYSSEENHTLEDCFHLHPYHWYGGSEVHYQYWPLEKGTFKEYSYVSKELDDHVIAEPYWVNSNGFMLYVDQMTPLFIDQNNHRDNAFCLMARNAPPYARKGGPSLKYTMCKFPNPRLAHEHAINTFFAKPSDIPDTKMVRHPIWSTWVLFKEDINEDKILKFAQDIISHGFTNSQFEIDDNWETCYGSLSFNKSKFPNIRRTVTQLNKMGYRTTLWVHPFINVDCDGYAEALRKGYFAKNMEGNTSTHWWHSRLKVSGHIDFTNPAAADWYEKRLRNVLAQSGIDSLKFDAGESSFLPQIPFLNDDLLPEHPELHTTRYAEVAAKFGPMVEVRSGRKTQNLPIYIRMIDRHSAWHYLKAGLQSVLHATFILNLSGYRFVMPDMVGGNAYANQNCSKELFIRFLQANVFLPVIQFSLPPWDYDDETVELTKKFISLHQTYADKIIDLMRETVRTGQPINMPIWWIDPTNEVAQGISSEYLLGEDILVAPVVEEGATSRDIYLPRGVWQDEVKADKPLITGPVWLRNYPAPLETLPYFTRISSGAQFRISFSLLLILFAVSLFFR